MRSIRQINGNAAIYRSVSMWDSRAGRLRGDSDWTIGGFAVLCHCWSQDTRHKMNEVQSLKT
jgi:hypothetical protein